MEESVTTQTTPVIRITVDGKPALTVDMISTRRGWSPATTRKTLQRLRDSGALQPITHLDARTPLYAAAAVEKALTGRPGQGRRAERGPSLS